MIFIKTLQKILKQGLTLKIAKATRAAKFTTKRKERKGYWLDEGRIRGKHND